MKHGEAGCNKLKEAFSPETLKATVQNLQRAGVQVAGDVIRFCDAALEVVQQAVEQTAPVIDQTLALTNPVYGAGRLLRTGKWPWEQ